MRPDTPQHYEYVLVEDITGRCGRFLFIHPWTQFFNPLERADMPQSRCNDITMRNILVETKTMFDVQLSDKYALSAFRYEGEQITF